MTSILFISADHDLSQSVQDACEASGWSCTCLEHIPHDELSRAFDCVAVDEACPGAPEWLSLTDRPAHPPVVAIALPTALAELLTWSVADFVLQPIKAEELSARIARLTQRRPYAAELFNGAGTIDFFESLINASSDAFVVTDMKGEIRLFNPGAERLCGQRAEDVIGKLHLSELLTVAGAEATMERVASAALDPDERLEPMIVDAIAANGDAIPVRLSISLARQDDEPVAIVLAFNSLRDTFLAEERLAEAQKRTSFNEKQSVLAELAGTAAHKLNQPLTSVMAYAELLKKKSEPGSVGENVADVLLKEADRMADIVRKLGRIARYETTSYVGSQKIFDLDRAVEGHEPGKADKSP